MQRQLNFRATREDRTGKTHFFGNLVRISFFVESRPAFPLSQVIDAPVSGDLQDPRARRGIPTKSSESGEGTRKDFLRQVFGSRSILHDRQAETKDLRSKAAHEPLPCTLVISQSQGVGKVRLSLGAGHAQIVTQSIFRGDRRATNRSVTGKIRKRKNDRSFCALRWLAAMGGDRSVGPASAPTKGKRTMTHSKHSPIRICKDHIQFGPEGAQVRFMRTLRIPDDGKKYPLPPGFGSFPIRRVHDYLDRVPEEWRERGGIFLPMYQREAMWLNFSCPSWRPRALQLGVGKVCAITGARWTGTLSAKKQNYMVIPKQPWLDGIATGKGTIRQFVAMPLGMGYTVEAQVTGEEVFGGLQLKMYEPKQGRFPKNPPPQAAPRMRCAAAPSQSAPPSPCAPGSMGGSSMGLAAGGRMKQKIYQDHYGLETWDRGNTSRLYVHLVNSQMWREITGEEAPRSPVTAKEYERTGLPWYDIYDEGVGALEGSEALATVKSVSDLDIETFGGPTESTDSATVEEITSYAMKDPNGIYDGNW